MTHSVLLIGAGLTGMVQAVALAQQGFAVTLVGPPPRDDADERSTAILRPGIDFLAKLGLWSAIAPSATPLITMELIDGSQQIVFDASEIELDSFGDNIGNTALKRALVAAVRRHKAITWHPHIATAFDKTDHGWTATLENGTTVSGALLIGADGRNSLVREAAGIAIDEKTIDQVAMVGLVKAGKPHFNTTVEWYRRGGPMTFVPVGRDQFAFVWCDTAEAHAARSDAPPAMIATELTEQTGQRFGLLALQGRTQLWPIRPFLAQRLAAQDCVLIGEAAHALPPIGAQGFNTSLQDIMTLTALLAHGKAIGCKLGNAEILKEYATSRRNEVHLRATAMNTLNRTLLSRHRVLHGLRRLSMHGLQHLSLVKKHIMYAGLSPMLPSPGTQPLAALQRPHTS